jgi:hypothetical protein
MGVNTGEVTGVGISMFEVEVANVYCSPQNFKNFRKVIALKYWQTVKF